MRKITSELIQDFKKYLTKDEKSPLTVEKYIHDINAFKSRYENVEITKETVIEYKQELMQNHAPRSVNSVLSTLNAFFVYCEWYELKVKMLKIQRQIFASKDKELTKAEYERLLAAAKNKKNKKLYYLMQTICSTGIRIGELKYVTTSAVKCGQVTINCKGKLRTIFLPKQLCKMLKNYIKENNIKSGSVFVTKTGKPLDRSFVWKMLKSLCESAGVSKDKVFPHNFRHLFARTYYSLQKDIVRLADILGHSSVNTTRIYTTETGEECRKQIERLRLLQC